MVSSKRARQGLFISYFPPHSRWNRVRGNLLFCTTSSEIAKHEQYGWTEATAEAERQRPRATRHRGCPTTECTWSVNNVGDISQKPRDKNMHQIFVFYSYFCSKDVSVRIGHAEFEPCDSCRSCGRRFAIPQVRTAALAAQPMVRNERCTR